MEKEGKWKEGKGRKWCEEKRKRGKGEKVIGEIETESERGGRGREWEER